MRLQEILAAVPGLEKRFVHYLEGQGYIRPRKLQKLRIARRDYSERDLERIRAIWGYYQRGISVQRAYELLTRVQPQGAYVLFPAVGGRWNEALDLLKEQANVVEAAVVYGESADIVARIRAPHDSDIYSVLDALFEAGIISGLPQVLRYGAGETWHREQHDAPKEDQPMSSIRAWVLIKVPAKHIGDLVEELRSFPGIVEASAIYGETDVIAKIQVASHAELDDLIVNRIQSIENVVSTRTFIGIGGLHWQREA